MVKGHVMKGVCVVGGMYGTCVCVCVVGVCVAGGGVHGMQESRPLKRVVGILLECILVCENF